LARATPLFSGPRKQNAFTYVEVVLSVVLLIALLVPALQALQTGISGGATPALAASAPTLRAKMEEVLAVPFYDLYAQTYLPGGNTTAIDATYSDAPAAVNRRVVVLYRYDATARALSAGDTGLLYVSVYYQSEGSASALNTLLGRWW
jgi:hypothetical protein